MKLLVNQHIINKMKAHALEVYPNECCGFVFGNENSTGRTAVEVHTATNNKQGDQRRRFEIDPREYLNAERYAVENDLMLIGIYHSHPDHPAIPSEHDLKQAVPFFSYLILATEKEQVKNITSWQLDHEKFEEEEIVIENKLETSNNRNNG